MVIKPWYDQPTVTSTSHFSNLRPEKLTTKESNIILCVPVMFHKVSVLIRRERKWVCEGFSMIVRASEVRVSAGWDVVLQRKQYFMRTDESGLFCLVYQCILLQSGNPSQTAASIFSVSVGNEQTTLCLGSQMKMDKFEICPAAEHTVFMNAVHIKSRTELLVKSQQKISVVLYAAMLVTKNTIKKASCREMRQLKWHCYDILIKYIWDCRWVEFKWKMRKLQIQLFFIIQMATPTV